MGGNSTDTLFQHKMSLKEEFGSNTRGSREVEFGGDGPVRRGQRRDLHESSLPALKMAGCRIAVGKSVGLRTAESGAK